MSSTWDQEMVLMLRHLINDLGNSPKYDDCRLQQLILVAAHFVSEEISVFSYTIDVDEEKISPDPVLPTRDVAFIDLTLLKAVCFLDGGQARSRALTGGVRISDGLSTIDTKGTTGKGSSFDLAKNTCEMYEEAKWRYEIANYNVVKSILSPFTGEDSPTNSPTHLVGDQRRFFF